MSWRDGYEQGSFRGAKFFTSTAGSNGGRRINVVSYPERDDPGFEDLGRKVRGFSFSAYVLGDQYFDDREALIKALEAPGASLLIHPYRGQFYARCESWSVSETSAEGRIARFDMTFIEDAQVKLTAAPSTKKKALAKRKSLLADILAWFEDAYNAVKDSAPFTALEKAGDTLDAVGSVVQAAKQVTGAVPEFTRGLRELRGAAGALALNATAMGQDLAALIDYGIDTVDEIAAAAQRKEQSRINTSTASPLVAGTTATGPSALIQRYTQLVSLTGKIGTFLNGTFDSPEEALQAEALLIAQFDDVMNQIDPSDALYLGLSGALAAMHEDLQVRISSLAPTAEIELAQVSSALEISTDLYGSLEYLDDLLKRNGVIHPGFMGALGTINAGVYGE